MINTEPSLDLPPEIPETIRFDDLPRLIAPTAAYKGSELKDAILRKGIVDEVDEILYAEEQAQDKAKEVADVLWYVAAIADEEPIDLAEVTGFDTLDAFQDSAPQPRLDIADAPEQVPLNEELAFRAMRVVDVLNPKTDELWAGLDGRSDLATALYDLLVVLSRQQVDSQPIRLNDAMQAKLTELYSRTRDNHNVADARGGAKEMSSARGRLVGKIGDLASKSGVAELLSSQKLWNS
jgi:NTP pyrophosphatase (non-canonical NTP hydrolase)